MPVPIAGKSLLLALVVAGAGRLAAQSDPGGPSIGLGLRAGAILPGEDQFRDGNLGGGWRQDGGIQVGASVTVPLMRRIAGQLVVDWGQTSLEGYGGPAWDGFDGKSRLLGLTGRVAITVSPDHWSGAVVLVGGGGLLRQSFDSPNQNWLGVAGLESRTWGTVVAGVQGRLRLNSQMSLQLNLEQYFYTATFTGPLASEVAQRDTRASLGVYLPLGWQ